VECRITWNVLDRQGRKGIARRRSLMGWELGSGIEGVYFTGMKFEKREEGGEG